MQVAIIVTVLTLIFLILIGGFINYLIRRLKAVFSPARKANLGQIFRINDLNTHITIKGTGSPLILVHGSQMNTLDWRHNIDFFAQYFTVYAVDMIGCGHTDKPNSDYSPEYYANFIAAIMEHFKLDKASFIASSWGGGHVLHFALTHPEKVAKLILSSPCGLPHTFGLTDIFLSTPVLGNIVMLFITKGMIKQQLKKAFHQKNLVDTELVDSVYFPLVSKGGLNATVKAYRHANFCYVKTNLGKIASPTLLIWGSEDEIHPLHMSHEMHSLITGSHLHIIPNTGHLPHHESPDEFNRCALDFLFLEDAAMKSQ